MAAVVPYAITAAVSLALSFGASLVSEKLGRRGQDSSGEVSNGHLLTKRNNQERVPRIYGRTRVGVNTAYINTTGGNNAQLHIIALLGEGPIKGVVRQNGDTWETTADDFTTSNPPLVYMDGQLWTDFPSAGAPFIEFYDGSPTQNVCNALKDADPNWQDALRNTAYLYIRLWYDRDKVMVQPNTIQVVVDGLECYDPFTTNTEWTNNPAIVAYNYMTASRFRGGMGIPASKIELSSLFDLKNYCDAKGWTANIPIYEGKPDSDNLQAILDGGRARIVESGLSYKFKFFDLNYESTVMNLTDADIVADNDGAESLQFSQPDIMDRANTVRIKYLNETGYRYNVDDFVLSNDTAIEEDGGDKRELSVSVHGLSNPNLAQQMGYYHLERARYNRVLSGHFGRRCMGLEPMDLITLTFEPFGWDQKYFRVIQHSVQADYTAQMTLVEEALSLYNDIFDPESIEVYDTNLLSITDPPPSVENVVYREEAYDERGRTRSRIIADFDPPPVAIAPFWSYAEVWVRRLNALSETVLNRDFARYSGVPPNVNFADWQEVVNDGAASFEYDNGGKLTVTAAPANWFNQYFFQDVTVETGTPYICSYSVTGGAGNTADVRIVVYRPTTWGFVVEPSDGTIKNGEFVIESFGAENVRVGVYLFNDPAVNDTFTVHNISLKKYSRWESYGKRGENNSNSNFTLDPVERSETYLIKFVSVTLHGTKEDFNNAFTLQHTVTGSTRIPSNISALTVVANGDAVNFSANWFGESDVSVFELRYGTTWEDGITIMIAPAQGNDLRATVNGIAPGTYTFWAAAKARTIDNVYSSAPISASVQVFLPPGFTPHQNWGSGTEDFQNGTFINSEPTTRNFGGTVYNALKLLHPFNPFTGTADLFGSFESRAYDLVDTDPKRLYGEFVVDIDNPGKIWSNNFTAATKWTALGLGNKRWDQIFQEQRSGRVRAEILVNDVDSGWDNPAAIFDFFEIQSVEFSYRYFRLRVHLEDPNDQTFIYLKEVNLYALEGMT